LALAENVYVILPRPLTTLQISKLYGTGPRSVWILCY
jgi:hypothetical protein